ncbi:MAG: hypothetical protein AAF585_03970 [Verrucomicrobiota bacterium]
MVNQHPTTPVPQLHWDKVYGIPIRRLLGSRNQKNLSVFGIELESGEVLNLSNPDESFSYGSPVDAFPSGIVFPDESVAKDRYVGRSLINLIYKFELAYLEEFGEFRFYYAVLDGGGFLALENIDWGIGVAYSDASEWAHWSEKEFFNAWSHTRIAPAKIYR